MKLKASYTIEASLIFPIILFSLITLVYITIYVHDLVCLQSIANRGILYIEDQLMTTDYQLRLENPSDYQEQLKGFVEEEMNKTMLIKGRDELFISFDCKDFIFYKRIDLYISKNFMTPFGFVAQLMNGKKSSFIKMEAASKATFIEESGFVRTVDFIGDLTSEITVISTWKDKYELILEEIKSVIGEWI